MSPKKALHHPPVCCQPKLSCGKEQEKGGSHHGDFDHRRHRLPWPTPDPAPVAIRREGIVGKGKEARGEGGKGSDFYT
jgi:hypothetical protein